MQLTRRRLPLRPTGRDVVYSGKVLLAQQPNRRGARNVASIACSGDPLAQFLGLETLRT